MRQTAKERLRKWREDERGSQVVGHVLVQVLVVFVVLALLQMAFVLHTRNVAIDAASEGARRAALLGTSLGDGQSRTSELLNDALGTDASRSIRVYETVRAGEGVVVAEVATTLPVLGPLGFSKTLVVSASAWKEPAE
ncbi:MAG: TadE/TadG family type IV pilus assembly protein [Actinomycetaceae bacterium]|nr:TadE/TadG family type IV pilus assembly protein [Actinomycetaceae bacterium]